MSLIQSTYVQTAVPNASAYLKSAREAAIRAAEQQQEADLYAYEALRPELAARYDESARQAYAGYVADQGRLANALAAGGLYQSGYADSARVAQQSGYRAGQHANERARNAALYDLESKIAVARIRGSAALSELTAQYDRLYADQANADRDALYRAERDAAADARYAAEWAYKLERDGVSDARYEAEQAYAAAKEQYAQEYRAERDAAADARYASEAARTRALDALDAAYAAAEAGDFSHLRQLGIDTAGAEALYAAKVYAQTEKTESPPAQTAGLTGVVDADRLAAQYGVDRTVFDAVLTEAETVARNPLDGQESTADLLRYLSGESCMRFYTRKFGENGYQLLLDAALEYSRAYNLYGDEKSGGGFFSAKEYLTYLTDKRLSGAMTAEDAAAVIANAPLTDAEKRELRSLLGIR